MGRKTKSTAAAPNAAIEKTPAAAAPESENGSPAAVQASGEGPAAEVTNAEPVAKVEAAATPTGGGAAASIDPNKPGPIVPEPYPVSIDESMLFELYVARVAACDTVHTIRRDHAAIFGDALKEAKVALAVFKDHAKDDKGE